MVSQKYHTPFCSKNCKIEHHDLVTVLCLDNSQKSDELPDLLKECIESYRNWDHNSEVPDPLEELRCPLIYLASAFGKAGLVKALLQDNFDAHSVNFNGETALHGAIQYIYRTGSLKTQGLKVASTLGPIKNRRIAFERILVALTDTDPKIIFVPDNDGNTVFHTAAENIWNDRENDRQGKSATFFQFCMGSMVNRVSELEDAGDLTRAEILEALNAENSDGDTIFHILARDYAFGFKTMKQILKKYFTGQVPTKVNKENRTVSSLALERNRKKAIQVFPEFLAAEQQESVISVTSESEISDSDSPSPSTSKDSEEFAKPLSTTFREPPTIVISDTDVPQVSHSIDEEDNSSSEVIATSKETVTGSADRIQANTAYASLATNPGQHDLLTVSIDSNLGKPSQIEVPSFLSLSRKSTLVVSPFDSLISAPIDAEVMYVTETVTETTTSNNSSETGRALNAALKRLEVSGTSNHGTDNSLSDPKAPFTITLSSSDAESLPAMAPETSSGGAPPSEERISCEESVSRDAGEPQQAVTDSLTDAGDSHQGNSSETEAPYRTEAQATQSEILANDTAELCDAQVPLNDFATLDAHKTQTTSASEVPANNRERSDDVASNPQRSSGFEVPQFNRGKAVDSSRVKAVCGSIVRDLFDPLRKQIPQSAEYTQLYTCGMLDTPTLSSRYQPVPKIGPHSVQTHESTSFTSLASASTESIHSESFESLGVTEGVSDERSTILKCITDNSFLEFLITEGLELDARSKQGVVDVVMTQYNSKLSRVESTIPKLAAQIRDTETTIGQQTQKIKQLQQELEFLRGEIVKNEDSLHGFINEQQGLSKQRKGLKRKVARCEGTMKHLLGNAKKPRLE